MAVFMACVVAWTQVSVVPVATLRADEAPPDAVAAEEAAWQADEGAVEAVALDEQAPVADEPQVQADEPQGEPAGDPAEPAGAADEGADQAGVAAEPQGEPAVEPEPEPEPAPEPQQGEAGTAEQPGQDAQQPAGDAGQPADAAADAAQPAGDAGDSAGNPAGDAGDSGTPATPATGEAAAQPADPAQASQPAADPAAQADPLAEAPQAEPAYPAFSGTAQAGGVTVRVSAGEGVLPEGTEVQASVVDRQDVIDAVEDAVQDAGRELADAVAIDVTLLDAEGNAIQPNDAVSMTFSNAGMAGADEVGVYRVADDASAVEEIPTTLASANLQRVEVGHFSIYVITDERVVNMATYRFFDSTGKQVAEQLVKTGDILIEPRAPEIAGKRFIGWYWGDERVSFVQELTVTESGTRDAYARYENAFLINFYNRTADGTQLMRAMEVADNDPHDVTGVTFDVDATHRVVGWVDADGNPVTSVAVPEGADHVDLYALVDGGVWVAFDTAGGTSVDHVFVQAGEGISLPSSTRAGYVLAGWADANGTLVKDGQTFGGPVTLTAQWEPVEVTYTVNYWQQRTTDALGASEADKTYDFVESAVKRAKTDSLVTGAGDKTYAGFVFNPARTQSSVMVKGDGSTIVNVYYDRVTCTINYYKVSSKQGPQILKSFTGLYGAPLKDGEWLDGYVWRSSCSNGLFGYSVDGDYCVLLTSYDFKTAGYGDNKGNETSNGVVTTCNFYRSAESATSTIYYYNEQADGTFALAGTGHGVGGTLTVHEKFAGYDLYKMATSVRGGDPTTATFWARQQNVREDSTTTAKTVYIASTLKSYELTYHNVNDESKVESVKYTASLAGYASYVPENPYSDGVARTFGGWYADEACTVPFDFANSTMPCANVKVYAKWTADQVTLTYDLNAPENPQLSDKGSLRLDPGTVVAKDVLPTAQLYGSDYTFDGWYTPDDRLFDTATLITSDTTVIGRWLYNGKLHVTYKNGSVEVNLDTTAYADGSRAKAASAEGLTAPDKANPCFLGWSTEDGLVVQPGESFPVTRLLAGDDDTIVLTAMWGPARTVTGIVLEPGEGTAEETARLVMYPNATQKLPDPTQFPFNYKAPEGHTFAGWKAPDGREFAAGDQVVVDDFNAGGENVLTAQWTARTDLSYTVNYLWAGSDQKVAESKTVTGLAWGATPTEAPIQIEGYTPVNEGEFSFFLKEDDNVVNIYYYKNVELTAYSRDRVYDGWMHEVSGYDVQGADNFAWFPDVTASGRGTDVGTYPVTFSEGAVGSVDDDERHIVTAVHDGTLTITPLDMADVVSLETSDVEKVYDGTPLAAAEATVTVADRGRPMALEDGGVAVLAAEEDPDGGYESYFVKIIRGQLAVEYSADGQTWTEDYAGIVATNVPDTMSEAAGNPVQVRVRATSDNLQGRLTDTEDVTVTPRHLTLTAGSASKTFDGAPLTTDVYELTEGTFAAADPASPEGFESVAVDGSQTYVGSSESSIGGYVFAAGTNPANYLVATAAGLLTVTDGSDEEPLEPGLVVTKTHEGENFGVGDEVTFTVSVTNVYDEPADVELEELEGVTLDKSLFEGVQPGATVTATAKYTVTEDDVLAGSFKNTVKARFSQGKEFEASDEVSTEKADAHLTVTKTTVSTPAEGDAYKLGETIVYQVEVTNDGNLSIEDVVVSDELEGAVLAEGSTDRLGALKPGESKTVEYRYVVGEADVAAGSVKNVATARATLPGSSEDVPVTPGTAEDPTEPARSELSVEKTVVSTPADGKAYAAGETVRFEVVVSNTGNQTLTGIQVEDLLEGATLDEGEDALIDELAPGESATLHYGYQVSESDLGTPFKNVARATAGDGTQGEGETPEVPVAPKPEPAPAPEPEQPAAKPEQPAPAIVKTGDATSDALPATLACVGGTALVASAACLMALRRRNE